MSTYQKYVGSLLSVTKELTGGGGYTPLATSSVSFDHSMDLSTNNTLLVSAASVTLSLAWEEGSPPPGGLPSVGDLIRIDYAGSRRFDGRVRDRSFSQVPKVGQASSVRTISWSITCGDQWTEAMAQGTLHKKGLPRETAYRRLARFVSIVGPIPSLTNRNPFVGEENKWFRSTVADQVRAFSEATGIVCQVVGPRAIRMLPHAATLPGTVLATEGVSMYSAYSQQLTGGRFVASFDPTDVIETGSIGIKSDDVRLFTAGLRAGSWLPTLDGGRIGQVSRYSWTATPKSFHSDAEIKFGAGRPQPNVPRPPTDPVVPGVRGPAGTYNPFGVVRANGRLFMAQAETALPPQDPLGGTNAGNGPWPLNSANEAGGASSEGFFDSDDINEIRYPSVAITVDAVDVSGNAFPCTMTLQNATYVSQGGGVVVTGMQIVITGLNPVATLHLTAQHFDPIAGTGFPMAGAGALANITANGTYTLGAKTGPNAPYIDSVANGVFLVYIDNAGLPLYTGSGVYNPPGGVSGVGGAIEGTQVRVSLATTYGTVATTPSSMLANFVLEKLTAVAGTTNLAGSVQIRPYYGPNGYFSTSAFDQAITTVPGAASIGGPVGQYLHHADIYYAPPSGQRVYLGTYRPVVGPADAAPRIPKTAEWGEPWDVDGTDNLIRLDSPDLDSGNVRTLLTIVNRTLTGSEAITVFPCHEDHRSSGNPDGNYATPTTITASSPQSGYILLPVFSGDTFPEDKYFVRVSWTDASGTPGSTAIIGPPLNDRPGPQPAEWTPLTGP